MSQFMHVLLVEMLGTAPKYSPVFVNSQRAILFIYTSSPHGCQAQKSRKPLIVRFLRVYTLKVRHFAH